jgi:hypothetical protein
VRIIHHQPTGLIGSQQTLVKLAGQGGRFGIQRLQLGLFCLIQTRAGQNKPLIQLLDQTTAFGVQRGTVLPDALHAGEQRVIQPDIVCQRGKLGGELFFQLL